MRKFFLNKLMKGKRVRTILGYTITKDLYHTFDKNLKETFYIDYNIEKTNKNKGELK